MTGQESWGEKLLGLSGKKLVLASASPRRTGLLKELGVRHEVRPVSLVESLHPGEPAATAVVRLAAAKALASRTPGDTGNVIVGADTVVVLEDVILGKPESPDHARSMLRSLSGRTHRVMTGVAVVAEGNVCSGCEITQVTFRAVTEDEIDILVDSGETLDKAGGYAVQGLASVVVESLKGDYFNVVGLPLRLLQELIHKAVQA